MDAASLVNSTTAEVAELLAKTAVAAREKRGDWMQTAGDWLKANPTLGGALLGGGVGGAAGGLSSLMQEPEDRETGRSMLSGALAGGLGGAGLGLAYKHLPAAAATPAQPQLPQSSGPPQFQHKGRTRVLDPQAVADNPGLVDQITGTATTANQSNLSMGLGAAGDTAMELPEYFNKHPYLTSLGITDIAHSTAKRLNNSIVPSTNPQQFLRNFAAEMGGKDSLGKGRLEDILSQLRSKPNSELQQLLATANRSAPSAQLPIGMDSKGKAINMAADKLRDVQTRSGGSSLLGDGFRGGGELPHGVAGPPSPVTPQPGMLGTAARLANRYQLPRWARWGGRAGVYGGIPLLQHYLQRGNVRSQAATDLNDLIYQHTDDPAAMAAGQGQ